MPAHLTFDAALHELETLRAAAEALSPARSDDPELVRWRLRVESILEDVFGRNSRYWVHFRSFSWGRTRLLFDPGDFEPHVTLTTMIEHERLELCRSDLERAKGVLSAAVDQLRRKGVEGVYEGKNTAPESSEIIRIISLAERKLRKAIRYDPGDEIQVQDAFESLLLGADIRFSREKEHIEYSSKTYVPDFVCKRLDLAIELKLCARNGREKEIIAEINDDILAYQTRYGNVMFIVYDKGTIRDAERFVESFELHPRVIVRVVKH
jgi:hypothetical protein